MYTYLFAVLRTFLLVTVIFFTIGVTSSYGQCDTTKMTDDIMSSIISKQFSKVLTGEAKSKVGNFASVDTKDARLTFNGTINTKKGNIFSINASAGVTEGVSSLFSNSKANANISLDIKKNFLAHVVGTQSVTRLCSEKNKLRDAQSKIDGQLKIDTALINTIRLRLANDFQLLRDSLTMLGTAIAADSTTLIGADDTAKTPAVRRRFQKYVNQRAKVVRVYDSIVFLVRKAGTDGSTFESSIKSDLVTAAAQKKEALDEAIVPTGASFFWTSIGFKMVNKNFYHYDSLADYADQVKKEDFVSYQLGFELNYFSFGRLARESKLVTAGFALMLDDNKDDLTKTELSDSRTVKSGTKNSRSEQTKYTAFAGDYTKDLRSFKLYLDYYQFVLRNKAVAAHLYPEFIFRYEKKPLSNFGVGLYFSFNDKNDKEGKAKVNAELYCKFLDLNNNLDKKNFKFHERNDIGIRVTFPLNINP